MTNYYLTLFNSTTWEEFLDAGGNIYGTTKKENRARNLNQEINSFVISQK